MNCAIWEERVALLAGGDLDAAEAAGVERHLNRCAPCRALAAELRLELDGLRAAHAEPIEAERYATVRGRVLAELAKSPRRRAVWPWAVPLVAAMAAMLLVMKPAARPAREMSHAVAIAPAVERERGLDRSLKVAPPKRMEARGGGHAHRGARGAGPHARQRRPGACAT